MKELRFHPQYQTVLATTAEDSFNVFRPNLEADDEEPSSAQEEESKESTSVQSKIKSSEVWVDSDSDGENEERRMNKIAQELNKQRRAKSKAKNEAKRARTD